MDIPAILPQLIAWAATLSGYPAPQDLPQVQFQSHDFFVEKVCGNKECNALGWYNDEGTIYIDKKYLNSESEFVQSLIVHELVHHFQHLSGKFNSRSCDDSLAREREAYRVQNLFIVRARLSADLVHMPRTVCRYSNAAVDDPREH